MREAVVKKIKFMIGKSGRKIKDLTGQTFGELRVRSLAKIRGDKGKIRWVCDCSCGKSCVVFTEYLTVSKHPNCGCKRLHCKKRMDREVAVLQALYSQLRGRHISKGWHNKFLSFEHFKNLITRSCVYCGAKSSKDIQDTCSTSSVQVNGIDRIDSSKGYTAGNVVACCSACNRMKMTQSPDEFRQWVQRTYNHLFEQCL